MELTVKSDSAATALSALCIMHCLAMPLLASVLPFLAVVADAEWLHWLFAGLAIVISASVPVRDVLARQRGFLVPASLGIIFLIGGLLADTIDANETILTVIGAVLVAFAHLRRIVGHP